MGRKINILVVYTLADKDVMHHLLRHTDPLKESFDLSIWHDDPIIPGQPWKTHFESRIHHSDIVLLLVSDTFLNSQFIRQTEFKSVIDKHKEKKSVVVPVIINNCQWDKNLNLIDYAFNLGELEVLPDEGKPIGDWDSTDQACKEVVEGIKTIITAYAADMNQEESKKDLEKENTSDADERQDEVSSTEKGETESIVEEKVNKKEENNFIEEDTLLGDDEAQRRAEVAKKIMEAAEASAKRRAEEDRLWEEALVKRIAEKERRIREDAETSASRSIGEKEPENPKKEVKTRIYTAEKNKVEESSETAAILKAQQEKMHKKEAEAKRYAEENDGMKLAAEAKKQVVKAQKGKDHSTKKIVFRASLAVVVVGAVIWAFTLFNTGSEDQPPTSPNIKAADGKDSIVVEETSNDVLNKVPRSTKLGVGDIYNGGIIFEINHANNTGKIAHLEDAGPMPWQDAVRIHEKLGEGWRLPTFDELNLMYQTIGQGANNSGEFANELYWSATAYDEYQARLLRFWDGNTSYHYNKNVEHRQFRVRAIRDLGR